MKKRIVITLGFLVLLSIPLLAIVPAAQAASCNGVDTSIDFHCSDNDTDGISAILMYVINFMGIGVGIAVVIGIIFGGITYAMSDGDESKAKQGREIIANSIIGLFLFIFLYAGANFLIPGGAFNLNAKPAQVADSTPNTGNPSSNPVDSGSPATITKLTGVSNFRDAGTSGYIKTGVLYRSANLNNANKDELATLLKGGIIIDLRKTTDSGYEKDPSPAGVGNKLYQIDGAASTTGYVKDFINDTTGRKHFADAINAIANADGPVLVHCKAGKDRTGWLVTLVMMAVGVSKANAQAEYLKSPDVDVSWFNAAYKEATSKSHSSDGTILGYITNSVSNGGLGISNATIQKLKDKLQL